jgi:hypothetical protein
VVSSGGLFADSVAVYGNLVYVLDGGGAGAVMGYQIFGNHLFPLPGDDISLGLADTDPP